MMDDERDFIIEGAGFSFHSTVPLSAFRDDVMAEAMQWNGRDVQVGFPFPLYGVKVGDRMTVTVPQFEFQMEAEVISVVDDVMTLREARQPEPIA